MLISNEICLLQNHHTMMAKYLSTSTNWLYNHATNIFHLNTNWCVLHSYPVMDTNPSHFPYPYFNPLILALLNQSLTYPTKSTKSASTGPVDYTCKFLYFHLITLQRKQLFITEMIKHLAYKRLIQTTVFTKNK